MSIDPKLMKYVPVLKQEAVQEIFRDSDGYWIFLKQDWVASRTDWDAHVIHEETIDELRLQITGIKKKAPEKN